MKFLEIASLAQINAIWNDVISLSGDSRVFGRIEAYSCKRAGSDKKLYKNLEEQYQVQLSKSPEIAEVYATSPFGPLSESSSRRTLIYLISLLNASFPDYDFSNTSAEQFRKENSHYMVVNSINTILSNVVEKFANDVGPKLWQAVDTEIMLKDCDIYSYTPDTDSDPYIEDDSPPAVWSFHYFFYNKKLKRIIYMTCHAVSTIASATTQRYESDDEGTWMTEDQTMEL